MQPPNSGTLGPRNLRRPFTFAHCTALRNAIHGLSGACCTPRLCYSEWAVTRQVSFDTSVGAARRCSDRSFRRNGIKGHAFDGVWLPDRSSTTARLRTMSAKHLQNLFPVASNGSAQLRWLETSESHCATASTPSTATCASIALAVLLSAVAFVLFRYPNNAIGSRPRPDLRGPNGLPLLGNLLLMLKLKDPHGWQLKAQQQYGPGYSFTLPGLGRLIDVSRPDWIEHVQKTNFNGYAKGDSFHRMMKDVLGSGIFNVDGDQWKAQRKLASRIFTVKAFSNIILSVIREDTEQLDRILVSKAQSGEVFNIQELFFRFTLSTFVKIAFNQDTGVLANADEPDEFGEAFNYAQKVLDMRFVKPFWAFTELFNERGRKMRAARKVIDDFTHKIVGERLQNAEACRADDDQLDKPEGLDLLDLFIKYRTKSGLPLDPQSLKDAILNLMIAG